MCKAASMIVVNGQPPIWSKYSDSHERIRDEFKLPYNTDTLTANVQVEITPPDGNYRAPLKDWVFKVDQDRLPKWWDAKVAESAVRAELKKWAKQKLVLKDRADLRDGQYYILAKVGAFQGNDSVVLNGGTVGKVYPDSTVSDVCAGGTVSEVYGTVSIVYDGGTVSKVYGTVSEVYGTVSDVCAGGTVIKVHEGGTVRMVCAGGTVIRVNGIVREVCGTVGIVCYGGTISKVCSGGIAREVCAGGTVSKVYSGGTIIVYTRLDPACLKSSKAVMIDRSGRKVIVHIGKKDA